MSIKQKINTAIGSVGEFLGVFDVVAYIPHMLANLHGVKGQPYQPLVAAVSC